MTTLELTASLSALCIGFLGLIGVIWIGIGRDGPKLARRYRIWRGKPALVDVVVFPCQIDHERWVCDKCYAQYCRKCKAYHCALGEERQVTIRTREGSEYVARTMARSTHTEK